MQKNTKKIITVSALILLAGIYVMIFRFSADDGESSSAVSMKVTEFIMNIYYKLFVGENSAEVIYAAADGAEDIVRKLAHFTEYMAVGFLSYAIAVMWIKSFKAGFGLVLLQLFISAGADEFHQYFVPGRYASVKDVFIDVSGGVMGMIIILCAKGIKRGWGRIRERESRTCF